MTLPVSRLRRAVHEVPEKIGLDIQQTAEGFSISKSEQGRTEFTISASRAVQFKESGRAELHNVKIVVYGKDASRFDRIAGDDFEFDPKSGDVTAKGKVLIDLEANPEGAKNADQAPPSETRKPIHLETEGLVFNKDTGNGSASGRVMFETPEATGSAVGVSYAAKTGTMTLHSAVEMTVSHPQPLQLSAERGVITKAPREVTLSGVHLTRGRERMTSDRATFFLRDDNTVERILGEGNVAGELQGPSEAHGRADRAELLLTGTRNQLTTATLTGNVQLTTLGAQPSQANAGQAVLRFASGQTLKTVHAEDGVRLTQKRSGETATQGQPGAQMPAGNGQDVEMTAPAMDFVVKGGRQLDYAETSGPPQILILQPASAQKTVVTARRFTAKFTEKNRLSLLHGEPDSRIVASSPGQPDRVSTSPTLDVVFQPDGSISTITQAGGLTYASGTQKAFAERGTYTTSDQILTLRGSPRVVDEGMTTTAQTIRFSRATGDAIAEGDVKSTYSDLKAQPNGALLASSDPIHVVSRSMTAHRSPAVAVYTGRARLWQNSNVVEAPTLQFDRDHRSLVADATSTQTVKTILVQVDKSGKATPVTINSAHLTYADAERKIFLTGGVTATGADTTVTSRQMTVFLLPRKQTTGGSTLGQATINQVPAMPGSVATGQVEKIIAENDVVIAEPTRRATGERLVYTSADDRFDLTGGPPCIFDAERGKITGDSLTFFRHDDRVLVEGKETSPAVTRTQVAR